MASISVYVMEHSHRPSFCLSVCLFAVYCGKTAECIRMPFGMVSGMYYMRVVIVDGEAAVLGVNLGRPFVTNGDFDA